jgi:membrane-bound lytic murein transglycosylase F
MTVTRPGPHPAGSASFHPANVRMRTLLWGVLLLASGCETGETGDLDALRSLGHLRILIPQLESGHLPRQVDLLDQERELADSLARTLGLKPVWVVVEKRSDLIEQLVRGRGDLIAANLTVTDERAGQIAFSRPLTMAREQVVSRVEAGPLRSAYDLEGRTVVVRRSSSFWGTIERLQEAHPDIRLVAAPENVDTEEILYRVATGAYDVTVADDNLVTTALAYMPGLMVGFSLTEARPVAWGVRPGAPELLAAVDTFLADANITFREADYTGDLPELLDRGVLRVLTRNNAASYFVWRGDLVGFEYDLTNAFAARLGLNAEMVVPPTQAALLTWLRQGKGDVVAAALTPSTRREGRGIVFSQPYNWVHQMVVGRAADSLLTEPAQLAGRSVVVRQGSSYWATLTALKASGVAFDLVEAPPQMETEEIIGLVGDGTYDLTVADSHILDIELTWRDDVRGLFPVSDSMPHAWAVREEDTQLLEAINGFLAREHRSLFYNLTYRKYFGNEGRIAAQATERPSRTGVLSPYDSLIKHYSDTYAFDWRLIAAQMFVESRFNPSAESFAGAVGLMQVMPSTAAGFGVSRTSLIHPDTNTYMGVRYLDHTKQQIEGAETPEDLTWFALAAYNAGFGHLEDARRLAEQLGKNPNVWFGEVEEVMPLLARRSYHRQTQYGYCRCSEPVSYVRRIRNRERAYRRATDSVAAGEG